MARAAFLALALAACGGPSAGPEPDAGALPGPDAAAAPRGTWDDPIPIDPLPFLDHREGTVVYRIDVSATTLRFGVDGATLAITAGPGEAPRATTDLALEIDLGGAWFVVVEAPGAYALSVVRADPGACLENPLPACTDATTPDVNGEVTEPAGLGGCPPGMAAVDTFCIDRWEAALAGASPFANPGANPGGAEPRAVSAPGLTPQGYISGTQAAAACARAGKRLCSDAEWLRACRGAAGHTFPYGDARVDGACNDARACHPAIQYFESSESWVWSELGHPCILQLPDGVAPTGAHAACVSDDGIFDLMGNLHEWTADPAGTFRGGFYVDTRINGDGCLYRTTAHDVSHWDYSTGFRCCADLP